MRTEVVFAFLLPAVCLEVCGADKSGGSPAENWIKAENETFPTSRAGSFSFLGKLLVIPMDGSHWVGIKAIAQEMGRRGHQVTVVIPEVNMRLGPGEHYNTLTYPVPYNKSFLDSVMDVQKHLMQKPSSFMEQLQKRISQIQKITGIIHASAESLLFNSSLISHLAHQFADPCRFRLSPDTGFAWILKGFDAVLTDPLVPTGSLIARKLGIPSVNLLRGIPCFLDMQSAGCPSPPSYVPRFFTRYTDKMSFRQRLFNTLVAAVEPLLCRLIYWRFNQLSSIFLEEDVGVTEVLSESAIWLLRTDFTLEFPRPLMPNMVLVGGINCNVRNPLPEDLESWVSAEHGFVVFTLGSMVSDMPPELTITFLEAFRQIPQKVIWRYTGSVPDDIPENVKIMKWVPQNDLLAHPGARAFITHAGSHGLFEGMCHAVPMVMVPLNGDQPDNAQRLASRGVGVILDIYSTTTDIVLLSLNEVIHDARYKENVRKLSALLQDRPISPLDLSVYWTEFVMRHQGAKHLRAAVHDLNWFQYFCLDVIALMATIVVVFVILTVKCLKLCLQKWSRKRKQD